MDPVSILAMADGLISLLEKLAPDIEQAVQGGTITLEQQQNVKMRAEALFSPANIDKQFEGPEWEQSQKAGVLGFPVEPGHPKAPPLTDTPATPPPDNAA